jgi:hypothetical protein
MRTQLRVLEKETLWALWLTFCLQDFQLVYTQSKMNLCNFHLAVSLRFMPTILIDTMKEPSGKLLKNSLKVWN